jgi:glycosyltransferase involved in cell wall biosynthesis
MGDLGQEIEKLGIPLYVQPITHWVVSTNGIKNKPFKYYRREIRGMRSRVVALRELIEKHSIDVVYTNTVTCIDGALAARVAKRPHIWHLREHITGNRDLKALLPAGLTARIVAGLSDHIITNSNALKTDYLDVVPSDRISVVYNGIDLDSFSPNLTRCRVLREELSIPRTTKLVVTIGSISPRKGHMLFTEAAATIKRTFDDVAFLVIGAGHEEFVDTIKDRVGKLGLDDCFHFLGWRSDVADILRASDVLVVSSDQEPFGRTVVEGMATGVPVVATRSGGPEEIVADGETGFLVPINDAGAMANAIASVVADPELAASLGRAGRKRAEEFFGLQAYAEALETIIRKVSTSAHKTAGTEG